MNGTQLVRVGIVGLGRAGWSLHATVLRALPELYKIVAVSDSNRRRANAAAAALQCRAYDSADRLVGDDDVQLVVVARRSHTHASTAIAALSHRKHVLVEKPAALTLAEFDAMVDASTRSDRLLVGSQNLRYTADFLAIRHILESGALGALLEIKISWHAFRRRWDWQTVRDLGGGAVYNDGSHAIDQALTLLGDCAVNVTCVLRRSPLIIGDAEDHAKVLLSCDDGRIADIELSSVVAFPDERWRLIGTRGGLVGGPGGIRWRYIDPSALSDRVVTEAPSPERAYDHEEMTWTEERRDFPDERYEDSHRRMYTDLYPAFSGVSEAPISTESLRRQIDVLDRCHRATIHDIGR